jgi:prevent-host-death family protein
MAPDPERNPAESAKETEGVNLEFARANIGTLVIDAGVANKQIVITRHGKPLAALIGLRDLERLRALDAEPASSAA